MRTVRAQAIGNLSLDQLLGQNPIVPAGYIVMPSDENETIFIGDGVTRLDDLSVVPANTNTPL